MIPYLRETSVAFPLLISLSLQQTGKLSPLSELMSAVCEQRGLRPSKVRFFYKGERLTGDEVPAGTPSMKDGDEIAVPPPSKTKITCKKIVPGRGTDDAAFEL